MKDTVLTKKSVLRIKAIHRLSRIYNRKIGNRHAARLLQLIKEHAKEINQLYRKGDKHFLVETGDLVILCFEVLLEHGVSIDKVLVHCFKRYEKKLPLLMKRIK